MVESDYQILKLTKKFYSKYNKKTYPEILSKNNRPYNCILFQTHYDYFICVPFRTNINHNNAFKFNKSNRSINNKSGLDYSKMILVKDLSLLESKDAVIDKNEYKEVVKNIDKIKKDALEYLEDYIDYNLGKNNIHINEYQRRYKYTTLKYFHNEIFIEYIMFSIRKNIIFWFILILIPILITAIFSNKKEKNNDTLQRKIIIQGNNFTIEMSMEEFIPFVLMAQMPIESPEELLKAQTVVIRTYILKTMGEDREVTTSKLGLPFIMPEKLKEIWFEQYKLKNAATFKGILANFTNMGSSSIYEQNIRKLHNIISGTKSHVIKWQGNLILPLYHSVSNGKTRSGEENLGADFKYLKSVDCYGSDEIEGDKRSITLAVSQIQERIRKKGIIPYAGQTELFQGNQATAEKFLEVTDISNVDSAGYVVSVKIGDTVISGSDFADALGLASSCFEMKSTGEAITFETRGTGHGFGMSLSYAKQLAVDNYKWKKILNTFFEGEICIY